MCNTCYSIRPSQCDPRVHRHERMMAQRRQVRIARVQDALPWWDRTTGPRP